MRTPKPCGVISFANDYHAERGLCVLSLSLRGLFRFLVF